MITAEQIKDYALKLGIDIVRITNANSFPKLKRDLEALKESGFLSKFVNDDLNLITTPKEVLTEAESVIVCGISYYNPEIKKKSRNQLKKELRGRLARFTLGLDYHKVLGDKLEELAKYIGEQQSVKFVDTGPTVDRALAKRAGVGWQGKNCSIISPDYGSWIFLGGLITDLKLSVDKPLENNCGSCQKCIKACPTGALKAPGVLESSKCLGYITLSRGHLSNYFKRKLEDRLWGCDSCQEVCPANEDVKAANHSEFKPQVIGAYPKLADMLLLSNKEYKEKFKDTAMNWRGVRPIKRNAAIIMGNSKNSAAIPALLKGLQDNKPIVRASSAWALAEIDKVEVISDLKQALVKERDKRVKAELEVAISRLN